MSAVADVAASIVAAGAPLLFVDTCSLLDIVRGHRDAFTREQAQAAVTIIDLIEAGKLSLVLPEQITNELSDNFADVQKGGTATIRSLNDRVRQMHDIMMAFGGMGPAIVLPVPTDYETLADAVVARYLAKSSIADTTEAAKQKAGQRVITATAPAATGKQSYKDCLVLEACIETLSAARSLGFGAGAHFISTNVAEYADGAKKTLHPQLVPEFASLGLDFAKSFLELRYSPAIAAL